jgi:hypothetical protein
MKPWVVFGVVFFCSTLSAKFVNMPPVPLDRLIASTESALRENPNDPESYYRLGRLYSLEFAMKTEAAALVRDGKVLRLATSTRDLAHRQNATRLSTTDIENAQRSLKSYKRAVQLDPGSPLYHFSLGWMEEECSQFADQLGKKSKPEWVDSALAEYRSAYKLALPKDQEAQGHLGPYLTEEAGTAIIGILKERSGNEKEIKEIERPIADLRTHIRAITPLIFSLSPHASLPDLLSDRTVSFDLDGFDDCLQWPWIRSDTYILVWDPARTGQITSGRQLFGSVSWWMFWRNGYEALAALDDNGDGVISGAELKGISVWRDANSNGVADPGEVIPAEDMAIVEIAVRPREVDGVLMHEQGIELANGTHLTTFDWTVNSVRIDETLTTQHGYEVRRRSRHCQP